MFNVNDYIVYGLNGVCQITDIRIEEINNDETEYYILNPIYGTNMTIKVPVNNHSIMMRPIITKDDVLALIATMPDQETIWVDDNRLRSANYKTVLKSGKNEDLIKIIKTLYLEKESRSEVGRKLSKTDEDIMNAAEKQLYQEFAIALNISPDEVVQYILDHVSQNNECIN